MLEMAVAMLGDVWYQVQVRFKVLLGHDGGKRKVCTYLGKPQRRRGSG